MRTRWHGRSARRSCSGRHDGAAPCGLQGTTPCRLIPPQDIDQTRGERFDDLERIERAAGFALLEIAVCRRHGIGDVGETGDRELATTLREVLD